MQQYTSREISVYFFGHLHSLSLSWHLSRKTGDVLRIMDRGTNSMNTLLQHIFFNIIPNIVDIIIAIVFLSMAFNLWFGLICFITMGLYLLATVLVTEWRTKYRFAFVLSPAFFSVCKTMYLTLFLDASTHLCNRVCSSIHLLVYWSISPSVRPFVFSRP